MAAESSTSPAVGRALDVLTYLAAHTRAVPAAAIARDLEIPRSSLYHLLTVLTQRGFVTYLPEARGYTLGAAAYHLTSAWSQHEELERLARPVMRGIASRCHITAHLGILRGPNTLYLLKESPAATSAASAETEPELVTAVGVLLPAHLTANGRAILAHLGESNVRAIYSRPGDFVSRTGRGPRGIEELLGALAVDRQRGWSEENELVNAGLRSAGAVIFDLHGLPIAALSCTWRSRVAMRDPAPIVATLREGSAEITRRLHGVTPAP